MFGREEEIDPEPVLVHGKAPLVGRASFVPRLNHNRVCQSAGTKASRSRKKVRAYRNPRVRE
jgi:hypothetical protein